MRQKLVTKATKYPLEKTKDVGAKYDRLKFTDYAQTYRRQSAAMNALGTSLPNKADKLLMCLSA